MELPDPGTSILMSDPPTSHFVQPLEGFPRRLTLQGPVPRIAGLCRAAPVHAGPETATYENRAASIAGGPVFFAGRFVARGDE